MLETGILAPDFTLPDQNGEMHSLKDYRGKKVILYFYPRDNIRGVPSRHVDIVSVIRSLKKRVR